MLVGGMIAFAAPWLLLGLLALPLLWWLLRAVPPSPRLVPFPAIRLLFGLEETEETPHRTPWWLLALRLFLATLLILGLAQPLLNPGTSLDDPGPLVLVIEDDWSAAANWAEIQKLTDLLIAQAERDDKPVLVIGTAAQTNGEAPSTAGLLPAGEARRIARAMAPKSWTSDHGAVAEALDGMTFDSAANIYWLAGGLTGQNGLDSTNQLAANLGRTGNAAFGGPRRIISCRSSLMPRPSSPAPSFSTPRRASGSTLDRYAVVANGEDGRHLARAELVFEPGALVGQGRMELPSELPQRTHFAARHRWARNSCLIDPRR